MADYTTYATLLKDVDTSKITISTDCDIFGKHSDGFSVIVCRETNEKFESLLNILGLSKEDLPEIEETYITADQWREHGWVDYEGTEDFPISHLDWLNKKRLEWKGTDEQYEAYCEDRESTPNLYEWVEYGSFEDEYPELAKVAYKKKLRSIIFHDHYVGDDKAGFWGGWLGDDAKHGDFDCVIFAKDAAKHMRYDRFHDNFERAEFFVENAEKFAKKHGEDISVMFGFG